MAFARQRTGGCAVLGCARGSCAAPATRKVSNAGEVFFFLLKFLQLEIYFSAGIFKF